MIENKLIGSSYFIVLFKSTIYLFLDIFVFGRLLLYELDNLFIWVFFLLCLVINWVFWRFTWISWNYRVLKLLLYFLLNLKSIRRTCRRTQGTIFIVTILPVYLFAFIKILILVCMNCIVQVRILFAFVFQS